MTTNSTNVFQIWSAGSSVPLTVYARKADDADLTYREWVSIHRPSWSRDPARLIEVSREWLAERPQLAAAAIEAAKIGLDLVFNFLGHETGWTARTTYMNTIGVIAPHEPVVQYYLLETDAGDHTHIFAYSMVDAIQLYLDYYETAYAKCEHQYSITERSRWLLVGEKTSLREQMDHETVGIGGWSMIEGWRILPFDHEMAGE